MSLQDRLDAFKADFEGTKAPPEVVAIMHRATAELAASGQVQRALGVGAKLPAFNLSDSEDRAVSSADLLAKGPLVITFYRGVWCPYCNLDLQAIEEAAGQMRELGASVIAISPQTPVNSAKSRAQNKLSFPILSDRNGDVAASLGLRFRLPDDLKAVYSKFGIDLPTVNGDPGWTLPMPARYVIGRDGVIAYAEVNADYTRRPDPSELLPTLRRLQQAKAA
ncbi:MAG: alkyl hydroperoxide reductase/Thiol specific antioxidant/Mal allergen [Panacagrimonas sp.]|jgi:peroxiredoxin|nr:peroxiredoxin-like family protein [Panacagrimonas sp.]MCC2656387.1 alkyl hydroperoxide reductase/Thiol specific antioxidant/Mal allergen [Panacagrimonas sp.]